VVNCPAVSGFGIRIEPNPGRNHRVFLDAVRKSMRQVRSAIGAATINPENDQAPSLGS
jgi:hypothetical protein